MTTKSGKSSSNVNKHTSKSSLVGLRKEQSSHSTREQRFSVQSVDEDFATLFQRYCKQFQTWIIPEVIVIPQEPSPGNFPKVSFINMIIATSCKTIFQLPFGDIQNKEHKTFPKVLAIYDNYEIQIVLNTIILKHFLVDRSMLIALRKSFQKFDTIGTLK